MSSHPAISTFLDLVARTKDQAIHLGEEIRSGKAFREFDYEAAGERALARFSTACTVVGALSLLTYLVPTAWHKLTHRPQNLVKKYNAKWAVVTGGSSGIGLAIVEKLCSQGCNVVIVAYPDSAFEKNLKMVTEKYPSCQIRAVKVDLSKQGEFLSKIIAGTSDIDVQILFNNAGYIKTGFFCDRKKLPGCVGYTSSPAGLTPCPFSVIYGATKAYLTEFAASLAPELKADKIDVCVVHPSPVASRFYEGTHSIGVLEFFRSTATGPETIANCLFASMGRTVIRDQGYYPTVVKLILKMFDFNLFTDLVTATAKFMPEFKTLRGVQAPSRGL